MRAVPVTVIDGNAGKIPCRYSVYNRVVIFGLHIYFIYLQDEMSAELTRYPVKISVRRLVSFKVSRSVLKGVFKTVIPGTFEYLISFIHNIRSVLIGRIGD